MMNRRMLAPLLIAVTIAACTEDASTAIRPLTSRPATIQVIPSGHDTALVGTFLDSAIRVRVRDAAGTPIAGYPVAFTLGQSSGRLLGDAALTDASGIATLVPWQLGVGIGAQRVFARADTAQALIFATATPPAQDSVFATISVGRFHACALAPSGKAYCWGNNENFSGGDGTQVSKSVPTAVKTTLRFTKIDAGFTHTCAIAVDRAVYCWGNAALGFDSVSYPLRPVPGPISSTLQFTEITAGDRHTCAIAVDGATYCWGDALQIGSGIALSSNTPVLVAGNHRFVRIDAFQWLTFALDETGTPWCWGIGSYSRFPSPHVKLVPTKIEGVTGLRSISVGVDRACGTTASRRTWCWTWGEDGSSLLTTAPALRTIAVGVLACGITDADRSIVCWNGPFDPKKASFPVARGLAVDSIYVGGFQCALTSRGAPYCWGANDRGDLGTGDRLSRRVPTAVVAPE
jgi:hypothetical protein